MNEAVEAIENLLDLYDNLKDWQDSEIEDLEIIDSGNSYENLAKILAIIFSTPPYAAQFAAIIA